jgi:hypothetical protein
MKRGKGSWDERGLNSGKSERETMSRLFVSVYEDYVVTVPVFVGAVW